MSTKPEFTKPFNAEHARAGAPYYCANGLAAEIFKWDAKNKTFPLMGSVVLSNGIECGASWTTNGNWSADGSHGQDLVMTPLRMINGKPVFVGDKLVPLAHPTHTPTEVTPDSRPCSSLWAWPAPANVHPVSLMTSSELRSIYDFDAPLLVNLSIIANAVIKHAIDAGQLFTADAMSEHAAIDKYLAMASHVFSDSQDAMQCIDYIQAVRDCEDRKMSANKAPDWSAA